MTTLKETDSLTLWETPRHCTEGELRCSGVSGYTRCQHGHNKGRPYSKRDSTRYVGNGVT